MIGMIAFGLLWTVGGTITGLAMVASFWTSARRPISSPDQTHIYRLIPEAPEPPRHCLHGHVFVEQDALGTFLAGFAWSLWQWNSVSAFGALVPSALH